MSEEEWSGQESPRRVHMGPIFVRKGRVQLLPTSHGPRPQRKARTSPLTTPQEAWERELFEPFCLARAQVAR